LVVIGTEEHSDFVDSVNKLYLSVAEIEFSVPVALEETDVPTVKSVEAEPEMGQKAGGFLAAEFWTGQNSTQEV
jgi:hypothetical protein